MVLLDKVSKNRRLTQKSFRNHRCMPFTVSFIKWTKFFHFLSHSNSALYSSRGLFITISTIVSSQSIPVTIPISRSKLTNFFKLSVCLNRVPSRFFTSCQGRALTLATHAKFWSVWKKNRYAFTCVARGQSADLSHAIHARGLNSRENCFRRSKRFMVSIS